MSKNKSVWVERNSQIAWILFFVLIACGSAHASRDGLAKTPPMGWNSWNSFGCNISETIIRDTADALVDSGMLDAGYKYLVVDDCWQAATRDKDGNLRSHPERFPSGMKALGDYIHSKGLQFGIYTSVGATTCQGLPGSYGHERKDAALFASWGVDFVKDDFCGGPPAWTKWDIWPFWSYRSRYKEMALGLKETGRPIVLSLCNWGYGAVWKWAPDIAHMWRTTMDIWPYWWRIMQILDVHHRLDKHARPGAWNDPDMLEVGVPPLTTIESQSHFALWTMMAAPLISGNDLTQMTEEIRSILTNPEMIEIDQDPIGKQGKLIAGLGTSRQVFMRPLHPSDTHTRTAVVLLNRSSKTQSISVSWSDLKLHGGVAWVRDVQNQVDLGEMSGGIKMAVPPHGTQTLVLSQPSN